MTTKKLTKLLALYLPYILLGLVATNFGEAWRLAEGKELGDKIMSMVGTLPFPPAASSFRAVPKYPGRRFILPRTGTFAVQNRTTRSWKRNWTKKSSALRKTIRATTSTSTILIPSSMTRGSSLPF